MAFKKFNLNSQTALITGAGGLLGGEHAAALLESGASVILTDLIEEKLESSKLSLERYFDPSKILIKQMDVTQPDSIDKTAQSLVNSGIRVDILINNAAIDPKVTADKSLLESTRLENFQLDQWNLELAVGLTGAFLCSQRFGYGMANDGKGGTILNIASDLSVLAPDQRLYRRESLDEQLQPVKPVTYSVIKAGLVGLTRYLSTYWPNRVRCNSLSPGGVFNGQNEDFVQRLSTLIPMGRMAYRDEYRSAVQFLCSDASSYMNGQNIVMDGGRSVW